MTDNKTTVAQLRQLVKEMIDEREWNEFHTAKNLACKISVEASELLEIFTWLNEKESVKAVEKNKQEIQDELADIITCCICFANATNIDISKAVIEKLEEVKNKYPVDQCKGKAQKYTAYKK